MIKLIKVYVTKYAITKGVIEIEVEECGEGTGVVKWGYAYLHAGEWFLNREMALIDAQKRIRKRLENIKKMVKKLEERDAGYEAELYKRGF